MSADLKPNLLSPRWSKVFTDLWEDKTRTGLVVASIAAGVFAIGMILTAYMIMTADVGRSFAAVSPPNIEVMTDPYQFGEVKEALEKAGFTAEFGEVTMKPLNDTELAGDDALRMQKLLDAIESLDDVQAVYSSAAMDEE